MTRTALCRITAAVALVGAMACSSEAPLGAAVRQGLTADMADPNWLSGWELPRSPVAQKSGKVLEQSRGSLAVFRVEMPLRPMIRGIARLRSGKDPYRVGVPIRGSVTITVSAGGRDRTVLDQAFQMPDEFVSFAWNEPLDEFAGEPATVTLRVDPGEAVPNASHSHQRLRVDWVELRIEGFEKAESAASSS